ncbi:hypothetical protein SAMN04488569_101821 [Marinilactibacillus piezotolerans]|uniref:Lipoprotein n=1 Tax=Marinilactibacillus piezotolerans TaxID=258723 RepID=A0A1I3Y0R8_9LACT|nr:hypothetical protein [Marinilactibacillus piezotolerans]SFK25362.1 hypothetical protein SAMN04488569_101821 [Marinilactibacillus piezotolerans]
MKKILSLFLATALLGACTEGDSGSETITTEEEAAVEEEVSDTVATDQEMAPASDSELEDAEVITDLSDYEEFKDQDVFDPTQFETYAVEDNTAVRVIIFLEDDEQVSKTIYIKEDNRFKVIDLRENELLLNTPI